MADDDVDNFLFILQRNITLNQQLKEKLHQKQLRIVELGREVESLKKANAQYQLELRKTTIQLEIEKWYNPNSADIKMDLIDKKDIPFIIAYDGGNYNDFLRMDELECVNFSLSDDLNSFHSTLKSQQMDLCVIFVTETWHPTRNFMSSYKNLFAICQQFRKLQPNGAIHAIGLATLLNVTVDPPKKLLELFESYHCIANFMIRIVDAKDIFGCLREFLGCFQEWSETPTSIISEKVLKFVRLQRLFRELNQLEEQSVKHE